MRRGWDEGVPDASSAIYTITVDGGGPEHKEKYRPGRSWKVFAVAIFSSIANQFKQAEKPYSRAGELTVHFYEDRAFPRNRIVLESGEIELFMLIVNANDQPLDLQTIMNHIIVSESESKRQDGRERLPTKLSENEIDAIVLSINEAFSREGLPDQVISKRIVGDQVFYLLNPKLNLEQTITATTKRVHDKNPDTMRRIQPLLTHSGEDYRQ